VIHAAEGTDEAARREIHILAEAGALTRSTILVHGVGVDRSDVSLIRRRGAGVVWCPSSNHFTLGRSLDAAILKSAIPVALGTDSAITADGDLLDELRVAHRSVNAHRLYGMVTSEPARMFKLPVGFGQICNGGPADLLVIKDNGRAPATALLENYPELVIVRGRVQLVSSELAPRCPPDVLKSLHPLEVEGRGVYMVAEPVASLLNETKRAVEEPLRLAGKAIAA
jgi:cytosine/adenosine deaminase-related metal-dependent hydrolase